ncbi:hypothetical protein McpSp1_09470 [Methanocorpusculaceae archaeon Sp1]|nr:hypothetical protein [Methanocorpusculaceae archaeon Sp1]
MTVCHLPYHHPYYNSANYNYIFPENTDDTDVRDNMSNFSLLFVRITVQKEEKKANSIFCK